VWNSSCDFLHDQFDADLLLVRLGINTGLVHLQLPLCSKQELDLGPRYGTGPQHGCSCQDDHNTPITTMVFLFICQNQAGFWASCCTK